MFVGPQTQTNRVEKVYETLPVNAASELRKRPPSLCVSSKVNVLQKAKVRGVSVCLCVCVCQMARLLFFTVLFRRGSLRRRPR